MLYAEVSVNSPVARRRAFSYSIPDGLSIDIGQAVWVPFGEKIVQGIVLEINPQPSVADTKDIAGVVQSQPLLPPSYVKLARWLSDYYLCPLFDALSPMLPPGFERKTLTFVSATDKEPPTSLPNAQQQVYDIIKGQDSVPLTQLERKLGKKKAQTAVSQLVAAGLLIRSYQPQPIRIKPKEEPHLSLAAPAGEIQPIIDSLKKKALRQAALLQFLKDQPQPVATTEARQQTGCQAATIRSLVDKSLVKVQSIEVKRQPLTPQSISSSPPPELSAAQRAALKTINAGLAQQKPSIYLLHGVTGSGKTEVYLQALAETVRHGKRGIVLVPEIALAPQTVERFAARFPGRVAVLHSRLSPGERFDQWRQIQAGEYDVVIGARSALFAPQPDLGLIVIDEEHEWAYKQDSSPRYHARRVAIELGKLTGASIILGSATPDVETMYRAQKGYYHLLTLPERLTPHYGSALPEVTLVDLRDELKAGNSGLFSRQLKQAIQQAVANREQVMLFLNRRGAASLIQCRKCGFVLSCRRCQAPLSYHPAESRLLCHRCRYQKKVPQQCPRCGSQKLKFLGVGTQKLEQEAAAIFPGARLLRWDSDATRGQHSYQEIMDRLRNHEADILIGTQMIAKGLDLPRVTLVGVVSADTGLNLPDFRAGERTFQLLCQVAGRAGRGALGGRVIIQSYCPEHYAVQAAVGHDYTSFYHQEIAYRRQLHYPPFSQLVRLVFSHVNNTACQREARRLKQLLANEIEAQGIADIKLAGPSPAFIPRLRGRYRWQISLRGADPAGFLSPLDIPAGWVIDVDPLGLA